MTDATLCKVCGGPFAEKRIIIDGQQYHERCSVMSYPSHTHHDYAKLSSALDAAIHLINSLRLSHCDPVVLRCAEQDFDSVMEQLRCSRDSVTP